MLLPVRSKSMKDGKYQLYAREVTLAGVRRDLHLKYEALKKELEEMECLLRNTNRIFQNMQRPSGS